MNKINNKKRVRLMKMGVISFLFPLSSFLFMTGCSDYSDYNSVPSAGDQPSAGQTLWENIAGDQQLTKFAALAQKSKFSEALNSPRFYTVWAPIDAAIPDAEYNRLMSSDSATIVKQFMQQHTTGITTPYRARLMARRSFRSTPSITPLHRPLSTAFPIAPSIFLPATV